MLSTGTDPVHPRIRHDDRFYPYFTDAIGAIDETYIPAHVLKDRQARYRNRKNVISQNVMGVCGFDLIFHYVGVEFEGAAADMMVLRRAIEVGGFTVPQGKYYLVDSGYGNAAQFLAPYRGERYHILQYQNCGNATYRNMRDKFNHRHAQLCNCVERCFGVLKNRFQTLREGNCYLFRVQVLIVLACCVVHNFIRREHGEDYYFNLRQMDNVEDDDDPPNDPNLVELTYSMVILKEESLTQGCIVVQWGDKN
ncbi:hypothetical protein Taro_024536 [Colocasia esculenta]|uniref:DDE Tnp4 domain-containing protein n=1 Tax=Colocasia esculenta TaxID=4460 RepID=A0A843V718_COLES|nr:hypothetical protein [Colocasia esculenta]